MQVSQGGCVLHLSEHEGDCSPRGALRIETNESEELQGRLAAKGYRGNRPAIEEMPWCRDMSVTDPFGNRLTFTGAGGT